MLPIPLQLRPQILYFEDALSDLPTPMLVLAHSHFVGMSLSEQ